MVSGSDEHGTPITIKAEQEGKTPEQVATYYHNQFVETFKKLGISFDLFTNTNTPNHAQVTQDFFLTLLNKGYIYKDTVLQAWCPKCKRFLTDRYIEGTCPFCSFTGCPRRPMRSMRQTYESGRLKSSPLQIMRCNPRI